MLGFQALGELALGQLPTGTPFASQQFGDGLVARRIRRTPTDDSVGFNPNLNTNPLPFNQFDWSRPKGFYPNAFFEAPFNPSLLTVPVVNPFFQTDWTPVHKPPTTTAPEATFNPNLFLNALPFNQFEYPRVFRVPQAPYDLSIPPNLNLPLPIPVVPPFLAYVPPVYRPQPSKPDLSQGFMPTRPVPPAGAAQYRLLIDHYILSPSSPTDLYYPGGTIVTEGIEIPFGWTPTIAVEPLNSFAIQVYWNAGPPGGAQYNMDFIPFPIVQYLPRGAAITTGRVKIFWQQLPGVSGQFILTGAGAILGPK